MKVAGGIAAQAREVRNPNGELEIALDIFLDSTQLPSRQRCDSRLRCHAVGEMTMLQVTNSGERHGFAIGHSESAILRMQLLHLAQQRQQKWIGDVARTRLAD